MTRRVIQADGDAFLGRDGLTPRVAPWEDGLRTDAGPGSFEFWYVDAVLDDGSAVAIQFNTKPFLLRSAPLSPFVQIMIVPGRGSAGDQERLLGRAASSPEQFAAARDRCDVRIGRSWLAGDLTRYRLHAEAEGLTADLMLTGLAPAWRPGAGKLYYDEALSEYFAWLAAVPYGIVEGTLSYSGRGHRVRGAGYHDHNWGTVDLPAVISRWCWGRGHAADFTVVFAEIEATEAYGRRRSSIFMLARGDRILVEDGYPFSLHVEDGGEQAGTGMGRRRGLNGAWETSRGSVRLRVDEPDVLLDNPAAPRSLAILLQPHLAGAPAYRRFAGALDLSVDLDEVREDARGMALYESMSFA